MRSSLFFALASLFEEEHGHMLHSLNFSFLERPTYLKHYDNYNKSSKPSLLWDRRSEIYGTKRRISPQK